MKKLFIWDSR